MDLFDGLKGAFRRWYVLVPILIITAVIAVVIHGRRTTQFTSTATIGVTTGSTSVQSVVPSGQPTVSQNNALVENGGVNLVANLLSIGLRQRSVAQTVASAGGSASYSVNIEQRGPSAVQLPIVDISVTGDTSRSVATTMATLLGQAGTTLADLQQSAGVPSAKYAKSFVIQPATTPSRAYLSTTRNVGIVVVVGVVVAFVLAAVLDNLLLRRIGRRDLRSPRSVEPIGSSENSLDT